MTTKEHAIEIAGRTFSALDAVKNALKEHHLFYSDIVRLRTAFDNESDTEKRMQLLSLIRIHDALTDLKNLYRIVCE